MAQQKRSGRRNNEHWGGQRGNTRGKEAQLRRRKAREEQGRWRESRAELEEERAALEKQIAAEEANPTVGVVPGALYAERERLRELAERRERAEAAKRYDPGFTVPEPSAEGKGRYTVGDARKLLRQGYTLAMVMHRTGVGLNWLNDIPLDEDGRGIDNLHAVPEQRQRKGSLEYVGGRWVAAS